ncbi:hypothetical protein HRW15_05255 [Streptomyces lunaelactis]|nr:hypothetical protein [Streptomyces lunaelactis]
MPILGEWRPSEQTETPAMREQPPAVNPIAEAEAEAIRTHAFAEADARRTAAEAEAKAAEIKAEAEADKLRIANQRAAMKFETDQAAHAKRIAELEAQKAAAEAAAEKTRKEAAAEAQKAADREAEQQRTEAIWKWGARGIYLIGLIIAAPIQFIAFWDEERPFLVAAPALLEGLALVLACGAAWAVAHRRDVLPYRIGIMIGALIAGGINMWHGLTDPAIGFNAGLIGTLASLGGPIVLMAYEHGIAQKADGIPSWRERRAANEAATKEAKARALARAEKKAAEEKAAAEKAEQRKLAEAEQKRRDDDRSQGHPQVWQIADALRSARGAQSVTEQIWADAWYRVTGSKLVGVTAEMEANSRAAQARMRAAAECPVDDAALQVESQMPTRAKRDPGDVDRRRFNGGVPPLRTPGDTEPYSPLARVAASLTAVQNTASEEQS